MNEMNMMSPSKVAEMYGGDKRKIGQAAQMGLVDPTVAVMAGMFIDRMRNAALKEGAPQASVAQEVMAPAQPAAGLPAAQAAPIDRGLAALPVPEDAVPDEYAGGGIVAFDKGGSANNPYSRYTGIPGSQGNLLQFTEEEIEEQKRLKEAGFMDALGFMRRKFVDPVAEYFSKDPLAPGGARSRELAPTQARQALTGPAVDNTYPDESRRGSASFLKKPTDSLDTSRMQAEADINAAAEAARTAPKREAAPAAAPTQEATEDFLARRKRMLKEAGVSEDPYALDRETLSKRQEDLIAQRKENKGLSLIAAGLSGMNTKNLGEFAEKAGKAGFAQYGAGEKEIRADQREIDKINRDLTRAEDAMKRGDVDKALEFEDKAEQRRIQLLGVRAQEKAAGKPTSTGELLAALQSPDPAVRSAAEKILGRSKTGAVDERFLREQWGKMKPVDKMMLAQKGINSFEQWAASQGYAPDGSPVQAGGGMGSDPLGLRR